MSAVLSVPSSPGADVACENDEPVLASSSEPSSDAEVEEEEGWIMELGEPCGGALAEVDKHCVGCETRGPIVKQGRGHTPLDLTRSQKVSSWSMEAGGLAMIRCPWNVFQGGEGEFLRKWLQPACRQGTVGVAPSSSSWVWLHCTLVWREGLVWCCSLHIGYVRTSGGGSFQ